MSAILSTSVPGQNVSPPGPSSAFPALAYLKLHRDPLKFLPEMARKYGDVVHLQLASRHDYLVNNPDYIKQILFAGEGMERSTPRSIKRLLRNGLLTCPADFHKSERRQLQPAFHHERVARYAHVTVEHAAALSERWRDGQTVDILDEMLELTRGVILRSLFGMENQDPALGDSLEAIVRSTHKKSLPFIDEWLAKLPLPSRRRYEQACARLDKSIHEMIEKRRGGNHSEDFLGMLLKLQEQDEGEMSDEQTRDEVVTMFIAGHETIGNGLTWTWHLLTQHPDVERQMMREIESVLGKRQPTFEDLPALRYTGMILSESLRLYPPVWLMVRRPTRDFVIGGYKIPARSYVHISQWVTQRDARYFSEPDRFDPQRWEAEAVAQRPKLSYFPFGAGARQCIGEGLAWMEGILALATIGQRWRMEAISNQKIEIDPLITLRPKHGLQVKLHRR